MYFSTLFQYFSKNLGNLLKIMDSLYVLHSILTLAVIPVYATRTSSLSRELQTQTLPSTLFTIELPRMDRVAL